MNSHFPKAFRREIAMFAAFLLGVGGSSRPVCAHQRSEPTLKFEDLLKGISAGAADPCTLPQKDLSGFEDRLFEEADNAVVETLNTRAGGNSPAPSTTEAKARAIESLKELERSSAEINKDWPEEKRFHFELLEVAPALVVKMTYRNRATFTVFGMPRLATGNQSNVAWQAIGAKDDGRDETAPFYHFLDLFPLARGPANKARFLAKIGTAGCGTGMGVGYYAYEWEPENYGGLTEVIKLEGAESKEDRVDKAHPSRKDLASVFPPIGELRTTGQRITLPFCWFSGIDTWDNPSLCAVETYDLSKDSVRFVSRVVNRPDLLPIAKAIQYSQTHDYSAVRAYCGSSQVALKMIGVLPPFIYAGASLQITSVDPTREKVAMGDEDVYRFEVEKRGDRWVVVGFQTD